MTTIDVQVRLISRPRHEFLAVICPDEDGYSAVAANYPEVISQGDTPEEAKANIAEAFQAVLEVCRARNRGLEYADMGSYPAECQKVWITVDAT